jgi:REP element-mobilizing transposase RayT
MKYNPEYHHRRSIRFQGYDYSQTGIYFVTICTYQRQCLFGEIRNGKMILNQIGKIVAQEWLKSAEIRQEIELGHWYRLARSYKRCNTRGSTNQANLE